MGTVLYLRSSDASGEHSLNQSRSALVADEALGQVAQAVDRITAEATILQLSQLSNALLHLLAVVDRDTSTEAAVDVLFEAARRVTCGSSLGEGRRAERLQDLGEAYMILRSRVFAARIRPLEVEGSC
jgi:hypothetical protein